MPSNQTEILNAIDSRLGLLLPNHKRLKYSYELEKNNLRNGANAWGAGIGAGDPDDSGVIKSITLNQSFFVVVTEKFTNRSDDSALIESMKTVYDNLEMVFLDFTSSKIGIPSIILIVEQPTLDEPDKVGENTISVKANFIIKHRKKTT